MIKKHLLALLAMCSFTKEKKKQRTELLSIHLNKTVNFCMCVCVFVCSFITREIIDRFRNGFLFDCKKTTKITWAIDLQYIIGIRKLI